MRHLIHPVYTYSVAAVHFARSLERNTLKLKCSYLFTSCSSILFIIVTQLTVCILITFVASSVALYLPSALYYCTS